MPTKELEALERLFRAGSRYLRTRQELAEQCQPPQPPADGADENAISDYRNKLSRQAPLGRMLFEVANDGDAISALMFDLDINESDIASSQSPIQQQFAAASTATRLALFARTAFTKMLEAQKFVAGNGVKLPPPQGVASRLTEAADKSLVETLSALAELALFRQAAVDSQITALMSAAAAFAGAQLHATTGSGS